MALIPAERIHKSVFVEIVGPERIQGARTRLTWHMLFATVAEYDSVRGYAAEANQQNLDRLEAELATVE